MTTATMRVEKDELCKMIQLLPDDKTPAVFEFLDHLIEYDEEPLSEDELAQIEASQADIAAGRVYTLEEFNRRLDALLIRYSSSSGGAQNFQPFRPCSLT